MAPGKWRPEPSIRRSATTCCCATCAPRGPGLSSREAERRLVQYGPTRCSGAAAGAGHASWRGSSPIHSPCCCGRGGAGLGGGDRPDRPRDRRRDPDQRGLRVRRRRCRPSGRSRRWRATCPRSAKVLRDGREQVVEAAQLVPGDVLVIKEGDRISADARLLVGRGRGGPLGTERRVRARRSAPRICRTQACRCCEARDLVFSGTTCTGGEARRDRVRDRHAHGAGSDRRPVRAGRAARRARSRRQVRRVAWLIALIAVVMGVAFVPLATFVAGLPLADAVVFAVGLLVGNVPEGLLPVITLALAVGVRELVRQGAVVKRLSAVETLGSTERDLHRQDRNADREPDARHRDLDRRPQALDFERAGEPTPAAPASTLARWRRRWRPATTPTSRRRTRRDRRSDRAGDARRGRRPRRRRRRRGTASATAVRQFHFDPVLKLMSTVDERDGGLWVARQGSARGAPAALHARSSGRDGRERPLGRAGARGGRAARRRATPAGACACSASPGASSPIRAPSPRPPRAGRARPLLPRARRDVRPAAARGRRTRSPRCHEAGIRIIVVTGDHGLTAAAVARRVGIAGDSPTIVTGEELDRMSEARARRAAARRTAS